MRIFTVIACLLTTTAAHAQGTCPDPSEIANPDSCIVGNWIGTSDAGEVFARVTERMAAMGVSVDALPNFPDAYGMKIYDDGFYATLPVHANSSVIVTDDDTGDTTTIVMDMSLPTQIGYMYGTITGLGFCTFPSPPPLLQVEVQSDGRSGTTAIPVMGGGPDVAISSTCSGNSWTFTMQLPQPVGPITYQMTRFSDDRFDEGFREMADIRFGSEE